VNVTTIDTSEFRKLLEDERDRLRHASGRMEAETSSNIEDALGELSARGVDNHLGDVATETFDRELEAGLDEGMLDTLRRIDDALKRIDEGTYGTCEICGKPIGEERLRAIPWTSRCIDHAR
jgi:DnaK suppressor protein